MMTENKKIKVTLDKSKHGRLKSHKACIAGLGLNKIRQTVLVEDTPCLLYTSPSPRDRG